jgi:hypothetical protein
MTSNEAMNAREGEERNNKMKERCSLGLLRERLVTMHIQVACGNLRLIRAIESVGSLVVRIAWFRLSVILI